MPEVWKRSTLLSRHPAIAAVMERRAASSQLRLADAITAFAGSMPFVYIHAVVFGLWMALVERSPWPTLTLVVSLEAIFLSTFVMIGQNRQSAFARSKAEHDFVESELELKTNTDLTRQIHVLTTELHRRLVTDPDRTLGQPEGSRAGQGPTGPDRSAPRSRVDDDQRAGLGVVQELLADRPQE